MSKKREKTATQTGVTTGQSEKPPRLPDYVFGRPSDYKQSHCQALINHMATGGTLESFGARIGESKGNVYRWLEAHEDFADAKEKGEALRQRFYENMGLGLATGQITGNVTAYIWLTKNVLGWSDKRMVAFAGRVEHDGRRAEDLTPEERMREIREMTKALAEIEGTDGGSSESA